MCVYTYIHTHVDTLYFVYVCMYIDNFFKYILYIIQVLVLYSYTISFNL